MEFKWLIVFMVIYCVLIVFGLLGGGWLLFLLYLIYFWMQLMLSFVGGFMLGVGLLYLLFYGIVEVGDVDLVIVWIMIGLLGMFFMICLFYFY